MVKRINARRRVRAPLSVLTPAGRQPKLEALTVLLNIVPGHDAQALARTLTRRLRLAGWHIEPVTDDGVEWELVPPPSRNIGGARAWDLTYILRAQPEVMHAAPLFRYLVPENAALRGRKASGSGQTDDPATDTDYEWSLCKANVLEAWKLFATQPGAGVQVGHPDTGYTLHPELADPARLLITAGYDYDDHDPDPLDDLNDDFLDNPGHGTGTGSVILSGVGGMSPGPHPFVSGVAPHALLIPIRMTESVVLLSMRGLRLAIDHARRCGAHVVSISLGGPFAGFGTHRAIERAVECGTIVLAAAGNEVGVVVFPAAFDEVIAVAASNVRDRPWSGSSHGPAVDISAPGESVWRAVVERDTARGLQYRVARGNGTSFAVATTAGVAALWISYHGWTALVRRYGAADVPRVFKEMLQSTCRTPRGWDASEYGPGIVDARLLLETPLPVVAPARKLRDARRAPVATDTTGIETLVHLLPDMPRTRVEELIADLLRVSDRALPSVLQDYGEELAFQLAMKPALLDTLRTAGRGGKAAATSRRAAGRALTAFGVSSRLRKQLAARH